MKKLILSRLREPSTWGGLAVLAGVFGVSVPPGTVEAVSQVAAGVCGLVAIFLPEGAKE